MLVMCPVVGAIVKDVTLANDKSRLELVDALTVGFFALGLI